MKRRYDDESSTAGSQPKKQRGQEPSRVLYIRFDQRGLAPSHRDVDEQLSEFNEDPLRIFILDKKGTCFVEFSNVDSAVNAFERFNEPGRELELRGSRCEVQFSDKNQVSVPDAQLKDQPTRGGKRSGRRDRSLGRDSSRIGRDSSRNGRARDRGSDFRSFSADERDRGRQNARGRDSYPNAARERTGTTDLYYQPDRRDSGRDSFRRDRGEMDTNVVHTDFIVNNSRHPPRADDFTVDNLIPIFAKCGVLHRMVIFCRERDGNKRWQCMTEYADPRYAEIAVRKISGQRFHEYVMETKPSNARELNVTSNSDRSFNFLEPESSQQPGPLNSRAEPHPGYQGRGSPMANTAAPQHFSSRDSANSFSGHDGGNGVVLVRGLPDNLPVEDKPRIVFNLFSCYGYVAKVKVMHKNPGSAAIQYQGIRAGEFASLAVKHLDNVPFMGVRLHVEMARMQEVTVQDSNEWGGVYVDADQRWPAKYFDQRFDKALTQPTASLHVSQVPVDLQDSELRTEIESIDNTKVHRIKWLPQRDGQVTRSCVAFLEGVEEAVNVVSVLNGAKILNRNVLVMFSRQTMDWDGSRQK